MRHIMTIEVEPALCDECLARLQSMCMDRVRPPVVSEGDTLWKPMTSGTRFSAVSEAHPDVAPDRYQVWGIEPSTGTIILVDMRNNELKPVSADWFVSRTTSTSGGCASKMRQGSSTSARILTCLLELYPP